MATRRRWLEHQAERIALQESGQNDWQDSKQEGMMAKAPPCSESRMRTPLPQQSSSSTGEEESQWSSLEDRRKRCVAFEDVVRKMLEYLESSDDLEESLTELKERLETPEKAGFSSVQIAQQARNERGQRLFETFRQGKN